MKSCAKPGRYMKNNRILTTHILESAEKIQRFTAGMTFPEFEGDDKTVSAVVHELMIIGEAAANISDEFREQHPEVPFHEIIGMRNRIVHEYWNVDTDVVWKTCTEDIPALKKSLEDVI